MTSIFRSSFSAHLLWTAMCVSVYDVLCEDFWVTVSVKCFHLNYVTTNSDNVTNNYNTSTVYQIVVCTTVSKSCRSGEVQVHCFHILQRSTRWVQLHLWSSVVTKIIHFYFLMFLFSPTCVSAAIIVVFDLSSVGSLAHARYTMTQCFLIVTLWWNNLECVCVCVTVGCGWRMPWGKMIHPVFYCSLLGPRRTSAWVNFIRNKF